ncbi:hypothetical protein BH11MYX4_BH11MYX4_12790 [soil metagenome]
MVRRQLDERQQAKIEAVLAAERRARRPPTDNRNFVARWVPARKGFLFPVRVMGALFRGKMARPRNRLVRSTLHQRRLANRTR